MYKLEKSIARWKSTLLRDGVERDVADELESHMREVIDELVDAGHSEEKAFSLATERMGKTQEIAAEFLKVEGPSLVDRIAISVLGAFGAFFLVWVFLFIREQVDEVNLTSKMLLINVTTLTAGLLGLVFCFSLGGYCVLRNLIMHRGGVALARLVNKIVVIAAPIGAGLVLLGIVAGSAWSVENRGVALSWDMKETGAVLIFLWYAVSYFLTARSDLGLRGVTLLLLTSGALGHFSWFVIGGMPLTTVSVIAALFLTAVFLLGLFAFRERERSVSVAEA